MINFFFNFQYLQLDGGYSYSELSDIVQLDGPLDNSDGEEEDEAPLDENDFLGIINAEALKALQDGGGSSDSISSGSDGEEADQLADAVEEVRDRNGVVSSVQCSNPCGGSVSFASHSVS